MYYKHGYGKHPLYHVWNLMKYRCFNTEDKKYNDYGGRGIKVCDEWLNPKVFIEWCLENGWKKGLQIDRCDNDGNYCPENCRFVTQKKNVNNQRLLRKNNTSGYRGITYEKDRKKWKSSIYINGVKRNLGRFNSPRLAAIRYDVECFLCSIDKPMNFIV